MIVGKDGDSSVAIYGATGRSASSLARKFTRHEDGIYMEAIDDTVSGEEKPELFEYPAIRFFDNGIVAANGRHIENISALENRDARKQLAYALSEEAYEPDEHRTPRITGCIVESQSLGGMKADAALHIVRFAHDGIDHASWSVPLENGKGKFLSTYEGTDIKPTPSFSGDPIEVRLGYGSASEAAKTIFNSYAPPSGEKDYRVGVIAVYKKLGEESTIAIVNSRYEH